MRYVGLDVGRDFAHAAVVEDKGSARNLGRIRMGEEFLAFAATLGPDDVVTLEASGNTASRRAGQLSRARPARAAVPGPTGTCRPHQPGRRGPRPRLITEAAHAAVRAPGSLATFFVRLRARRGGGIAIVAVTRKLAVLVWHLLTKDQDYREARPELVRAKH